MSEPTGAQFVLQRLRARGIAHVRLTYRAAGVPTAVVTLAASELEGVFEDGLALHGGPILGLPLGPAVLVPDPSTFAILPPLPPSKAEGPVMARLLCDLRRQDGSPHPRCSRGALKRTLGKALSAGDRFYLGARVAHRWLDGSSDSGEPLPAPPSLGEELCLRFSAQMEREGAAPRSWERLDDTGLWGFEYASVDPLALSDALVLHRLVAQQVADVAGGSATFMPRPWPSCVAARLELHLSQDAGAGADWGDPLGADGLSTRARAYADALRCHEPALALCLRSGVNGWNARDAFEAGILSREHGTALRVAGLDAAVDPYIAAAVVIALARSEEAAALPPDAPFGPSRILTATASALLGSALGEELLAALVAMGRAELEGYAEAVSPFERQLSL